MSDTHWSSWNPSDKQAAQLIETLESGFDQIWHAGDIVDLSVLEALERFCPVLAVKGNCDGFMGRHLPHSVIETVEQVKIVMIHGWDLPLDHAQTVVNRFPEDTELIIHGHTHRRRHQEYSREDGSVVTILNPGSVSSPRGGETPGMAELVIHETYWEHRVIPFS
jgi:putative phosphoesterase